MRLAAVALAVGLLFDRGHSVMRVTGDGVQRVTPGGLAACGNGGLAVIRRRGDHTQGDDLFVVRNGHTTRITNSPGTAEREPVVDRQATRVRQRRADRQLRPLALRTGDRSTRG